MRRAFDKPVQYDVIRLSYGLDQDHKMVSNATLRNTLGINVATANVRISQIKKDAIEIVNSQHQSFSSA